MSTALSRLIRDDVKRKVREYARACRKNGYTQPTTLKFTIPELYELDAMLTERTNRK